jgi:hypothetical protein
MILMDQERSGKMNESMRETMMRAKMCANCGLVDRDGGPDFAGNGLYWYCQKHLEERDEATLVSSQRVTESYA